MKFYALVLWRTRGVVPKRLQLMYLGDREVLAYSPDEDDLLATERKLLALWEAIEKATQARDFRPRASKLCDWCDHQAFLPCEGRRAAPLARDRARSRRPRPAPPGPPGRAALLESGGLGRPQHRLLFSWLRGADVGDNRGPLC